jgi:hypothetical protein
MSGVTPDQRPTREGEIATGKVRVICMDLPLVVERLSHGEASWFINDKKKFVAMSAHHQDQKTARSLGVRPESHIASGRAAGSFGHVVTLARCRATGALRSSSKDR